MATKLEIVNEIQRLAAAYSHQELAEETFDTFAGVLAQFEITTIRAAVDSVMQRSKFFPSVPEMFEVCDRVAGMKRIAGVPGDAAFNPLDGWELLKEQFSAKGIDLESFPGNRGEQTNAGFRQLGR